MTIVIKQIGSLHFLLEQKTVHGCTVHKDMRMCFLDAQRDLAHRVARRLEAGQAPFAPKKQQSQQQRAA
jgi:hypothetical protein